MSSHSQPEHGVAVDVPCEVAEKGSVMSEPKIPPPISNERLAALDDAEAKMTPGEWFDDAYIFATGSDGIDEKVVDDRWMDGFDRSGIVALRNEYAALRERLRRTEELLRPFAKCLYKSSCGWRSGRIETSGGASLPNPCEGCAAAAYFTSVESNAADAAGKEG